MMKEFQAENERRRTTSENNCITSLDTVNNEINSQSTSNDYSEKSLLSIPNKQNHTDYQTKATTKQIKINITERRSNIDRHKLHFKSNKLASDTLQVEYYILNKIF